MKHIQYYALFILATLLFSCSSKKNERKKYEIDKAFKAYITAFTSGEISKKGDIRIELANPSSPKTIGEPVDLDVFEFSPAVEGKTIWLDASTIIFRPDELLDPAQEYEVDFKLGEIIDVDSDFHTFTFWLRTMKPSLRFEFDRMESVSTIDLKRQRLLGKIYTADYEDPQKIEALFSAKQDDKDLEVVWNHSSSLNVHFFEVMHVDRKKQVGEVLLQWNGSMIGADQNSQHAVTIPALDDFKLLSAGLSTGNPKYISVLFSDPVAQDQDFNGFVTINTGTKLRFSVDKNELKVFPLSNIKGSAIVTIHKGIKNVFDYQIKETSEHTLVFVQPKPEIRLLGDGVIIPNTDGLHFPFEAINLSGVHINIKKIYKNNVKQFLQMNYLNGSRQLNRVANTIYAGNISLNDYKNKDLSTWNTFAIDLTKYIKAEIGAIYEVSLSFSPKQSLYRCASNVQNEQFSFGDENYEYDDDDEYDSYYYDDRFKWSEEDNPCHISYYLRNRMKVSRNVFASNLGIIVKRNDSKEYTIAVTDLRTTQALAGVEVAFYNYQQQEILTATTDENGFISAQLNKKPYLLVAKQGEERGYLRLDDGSSLSLSMFDVSGVRAQKGIKGFIYGERGVWRPGDSIFVSFLLNDELNNLPEHHPVKFQLYDPMNQLVDTQVSTEGVEGLYTFKTKTAAAAKTGRYMAKVSVGSHTFTKVMKVETIKPNRLKIKLSFPHDKIGTTAASQRGALEVNWLHGAVANGLNAKVTVKASTAKTSFEGYKNYHFDDVSKEFHGLEKSVYDGKTDANGKLTFSSKINIDKKNIPGFLYLNYKTVVTEKGGNSSVNSQSFTYSPFASYVGFVSPKGTGWGGALQTGEDYSFPVVSLDEEGKPISKTNLSVQVLKIDRRWWLEYNTGSSYLSRFVSSSHQYEVFKTTVNTNSQGKGKFSLKIENDRGYGRYLVIVKDEQSGHSSAKLLFFDWPDWYSADKEKESDGASMLNFITDKTDYTIDDEITLSFPSSAGARALLSIENGSQVLQTLWVETSASKTVVSLKATPEMAPGVYIHISYLQPYASTANDLPIRLYGIQRIRVNDPKRLLVPTIGMPKSLEPEKEFVVTVGEEHGEEMSYTLAIVEEGLLGLTNYRTPDPWSHFNAVDALGVKTWDMYKYVLGAFDGQLAGLLQIGGGNAKNVDDGYKANRFKPVVKFLGPFKLKKGQTNRHKVTLPNYIGAVRAMVVAGNGKAYGSASKEVPVKKPLMVLGTMPRVLGPDDELSLPVTVFAMDPNVKNVNVKLSSNELIEVVDGKTKQIIFNEEGERVVYFSLKIPQKLGVAKLKIEASGASFKAHHEFEIDVRNPNPYLHSVADGLIEANDSWSTSITAIGMEQTQETSIEVSKIPPIGLEKRINELIRYPHGCIEQTTSSVFPQLFLGDLVKLSTARQAQIKENINRAIERIKLFQTTQGGFSYWPGQHDPSDWGTNYATHFLLEAKAKGYHIPSHILYNALRYQKSRANSWSVGNVSYRGCSFMIQAYRLFTLAKGGKTEIGAMNRLRASNALSNVSKARLAAAYHLAGQTSVSASILAETKTTVNADYKRWRYTYGSSTRDKAMVIEAFSIAGKRDRLKDLVSSVSNDLNSDRWMSTQTTAYSLLALSKFIGEDANLPFLWSYELNGKEKEIKTTTPIASIPVSIKTSGESTFEFNNKNNHPLFVKVIHSGRPLHHRVEAKSSKLGMRVAYYTAGRTKIDPATIKQGTEFSCEVTITNTSTDGTDYDNLALTQVFPSGWEITNERLFGNATTTGIDYQDIRDDRVYTYFSLAKGKSKTIIIKLTAAYQGDYFLAPFTCSAMYDNDIHANNVGKEVSVKP